MTIADQSFYPGEGTAPEQMLLLAEEYKTAAETLRKVGCRRGQEPFRLLSIHAIRLYLNTRFAAEGHPNRRTRGLQHDQMTRIDLVDTGKPWIRKLTVQHLRQLSSSREYLISRYGLYRYEPAGPKLPELTRLEATLNEIARKVSSLVLVQSRDTTSEKGPEAPTPPTPSRPAVRPNQ